MKLFSPEKANALIPKLTPLVNDLLAKRRDLAIKLLENEAVRPPEPTPPRLAGVRSPFPAPRFGELKSEIVRLIERIEGFGCIVKDIDLGLLDFPGSRDGHPIWLCWKAGESELAHWHGTEEGFLQRKPLDDLIERE